MTKIFKRFLTVLGLSLLLGLGTPTSLLAEQTITYYHLDALGSPVAATDVDGNVKWREQYRPYGDRLVNEPAAQTNSRWFTGHPHDQEFGLTYAGARWYDPVVGRFLGVDPKGFTEGNPQSFNRYAYGNNNPYRYVDPDGESATLAACFGGPAACVIGVGLTVVTAYYGAKAIQGTAPLIFNEGAKDAPDQVTVEPSDEWLYGPNDDPKINPDGSTKPNTWTTPEDFSNQDDAADKLDPYKPPEGRRRAHLPKGTRVRRGNTPGGEGPFAGSGGAEETLIPDGLPPGSVGPWEHLKK